MLLRRLNDHVKNQNWIAVGLDFLIVVGGVFMGIQLGNWNDARSDRAAEISYLKRYHEDLSATLDMFAIRLSLLDQQLDEIPNTLASPNDEADAWKIIRAHYIMSGVWPPEFRTATYTDMVSSGRLSLISDEALRTRLVEHYSRNSALPILEREPPFRQMVRGIIPHNLQGYLSSSACLDRFERYLECPAPDQSHDLIEIAIILTTDNDLIRALNFNIAHQKISRRIILSIVALTGELRDGIGTILADKGVQP